MMTPTVHGIVPPAEVQIAVRNMVARLGVKTTAQRLELANGTIMRLRDGACVTRTVLSHVSMRLKVLALESKLGL